MNCLRDKSSDMNKFRAICGKYQQKMAKINTKYQVPNDLIELNLSLCRWRSRCFCRWTMARYVKLTKCKAWYISSCVTLILVPALSELFVVSFATLYILFSKHGEGSTLSQHAQTRVLTRHLRNILLVSKRSILIWLPGSMDIRRGEWYWFRMSTKGSSWHVPDGCTNRMARAKRRKINQTKPNSTCHVGSGNLAQVVQTAEVAQQFYIYNVLWNVGVCYSLKYRARYMTSWSWFPGKLSILFERHRSLRGFSSLPSDAPMPLENLWF